MPDFEQLERGDLKMEADFADGRSRIPERPTIIPFPAKRATTSQSKRHHLGVK